MKKLAVIFTLVSIFASQACSRLDESDYSSEKASFNAWIAKNEPEAIALDNDYGYYKLTKANESTEVIADEQWVRFSYTGQLLDGTYFINYYHGLARLLGTFNYRIHWVPLYTLYDDDYTTDDYSSSSITPGMYDAMQLMSPGDSITLFLNSDGGYGTSGASISSDGFQGELTSVSGYTPININIKMHEIVDDPEEYELQQVQDYVVNNLGMDAADSISEGLYLKLTKENPTGDTITEDSVVYIMYKGYFLEDGFVFDTNYEDVAIDNHFWQEDNDYLSIEFEASDEEYIDAWNDAIVTMRKGEGGTIVTTSTYAYGEYGNSDSTLIHPYTPLAFDIYILTDEEADEENS